MIEDALELYYKETIYCKGITYEWEDLDPEIKINLRKSFGFLLYKLRILFTNQIR